MKEKGKARRRGRTKAGPVVTYSRKQPKRLVQSDPFSSATTIHFPMDSSDGSSGSRHPSRMLSRTAFTSDMSQSKSRRLKTPKTKPSNIDMDSPPSVERARDGSYNPSMQQACDSFLVDELPMHLQQLTGAFDVSHSISKSSFRRREEQLSHSKKRSRSSSSSSGTRRSIQSMELTDAASASSDAGGSTARTDSEERTPSVLGRFQTRKFSAGSLKSPPLATADIFQDVQADSTPPSCEFAPDNNVPSPALVLNLHSTIKESSEVPSISRSGCAYMPTIDQSLNQPSLPHDKTAIDQQSQTTSWNDEAATLVYKKGPLLCSTCYGEDANRIPDPQVSPIPMALGPCSSTPDLQIPSETPHARPASSSTQALHIGAPLMCSTFAPIHDVNNSTQQLLAGNREPLLCSTRIGPEGVAHEPEMAALLEEPISPEISVVPYISESPQPQSDETMMEKVASETDQQSQSSTLRNTEASLELCVPDSDSWQEAASPQNKPKVLRRCSVPEVDYTPCPMLALFAAMKPISAIRSRKSSHHSRLSPRRPPIVVKEPTDWIQCASMTRQKHTS